jgi:hypothetical protein
MANERFRFGMLVRTAGLEPARPIGQKILSLQRLPVPPRPHGPDCPAHLSTGQAALVNHNSAATSLRFSRSRISLPGLK